MFRKFLVLVVIVLLVGLLPACTDEPAQPPAGLANPASEYCLGLGFREENRVSEAGEHGVCIFADGAECDSWDFLAGRCGIEHSYCLQQGFAIQSNSDSNIATCTFDDGTSCDELSFFKGSCKPGDNRR